MTPEMAAAMAQAQQAMANGGMAVPDRTSNGPAADVPVNASTASCAAPQLTCPSGGICLHSGALDPAVDPGFEHTQRQFSGIQNLCVEFADVEIVPQGFLGALS